MTLCIHGTAGYSKFVFDHINYWDDQISVALLVDPAGFPALATYQKFYKCTSASERVSTHLIWSRQHGDCSPDFVINGLSSQPPDPMPDDCNLETHWPLFKHDFHSYYPSNTLRNIARIGARTQGHLISDIENHFSENIAAIIKHLTNTIELKDTVIVVRRFESAHGEIPRNVSSLRKLINEERAFEFHAHTYPEGHRAPFLSDFLEYSTTPDAIPRLTPVAYQGPHWEPQLVVHQDHPLHFEGISFRQFDQQALPYELCRMKINFTVASHVFSVHQGIKLKVEKNSGKKSPLYVNLFRRYIHINYPDTLNTCGYFGL